MHGATRVHVQSKFCTPDLPISPSRVLVSASSTWHGIVRADVTAGSRPPVDVPMAFILERGRISLQTLGMSSDPHV